MFLPLLLIVGSIGAYAQVPQVPESYYNQTKAYDNQQSNQKMTISVDKFSYSVPSTINVIGSILNYKSGSRIDLSLLDESKKIIQQLSVVAGQTGSFQVIVDLPRGSSSGKYSLNGYYVTTNAQATVSFNVVGNEIPTSIIIPYGANIEFNKLSFTPKTFKVEAGYPITWLNNDNVVHTIASGILGSGNRMYADGKFDSGIISPGQTYTLALFNPGNYTYFDSTSPWLVGTLDVVSFSGPASQKPQPNKPVNTIATDDYLSVITEPRYLLVHEKILFNDNMTSLFTIGNKTKTDNFTLYDTKDTKIGRNSMHINPILKNGTATLYHDYSLKDLQNWANYNYLNFWLKGKNTKQTFQVDIRDQNWKTVGYYTVTDDSSDWKKVQIPLYSTYKNMDLSRVRGLEFVFNKGTNDLFLIDDIQLISEGKKIISNENMVSMFRESTQSGSSIDIFGSNDSKSGATSLGIHVKINDGTGFLSHDYSVKNLQDWSNFGYLNFWLKGSGNQGSFQVDIRDQNWKTVGYYTVTDDSSDWKKVQIPLYSTYKNMDLSRVRGLEFVFNQGSPITLKIDDISLSINNKEQTLSIVHGAYIYGQTISIIGQVKVRELGAAATIKIFSPSKNILSVNQALPINDSNTFSFDLPITGNQFTKEGVYEISAQYGILEHRNNASFTLLIPHLTETYKRFDVYNLTKIFYAIPKVQSGFDINRIVLNQYSMILVNNTIDNINKTIDAINPSPTIPVKTPPVVVSPTPKPEPTFPVPNYVLLSIWQNRKDLQTAFPEVEQGNLTGLKKWAATMGWNQEPSLSPLIPRGEIPSYLIKNETIPKVTPPEPTNFIPFLQIVISIVVIVGGGVYGYKLYKNKKSKKSKTNAG